MGNEPVQEDRSCLIHEGERLDDLQRDGRFLIQKPGRFCFGIDAVLLSEFAKAFPGEHVMDLCSGTGIVPVLMSGRYPGASYEALEIQEDSAEMARRSVAWNHLEDQIVIHTGDLRDILSAGLLADQAGRFDVVTVNPPYLRAGTGKTNQGQSLSVARHEVSCTLADVLSASARLLRSKGRLYLIHRPIRLAEILTQMQKARIEPKRIRFCYPRLGAEANLVLIEGLRDAAGDLRVLPPLIVYGEDGQYTEEIRQIYYGKSPFAKEKQEEGTSCREN